MGSLKSPQSVQLAIDNGIHKALDVVVAVQLEALANLGSEVQAMLHPRRSAQETRHSSYHWQRNLPVFNAHKFQTVKLLLCMIKLLCTVDQMYV